MQVRARACLCVVWCGFGPLTRVMQGWDKTYCLQHVTSDNFTEIHFFGDKYLPGQNDYEIITDSRVVPHPVNSPDDTMRLIRELWSV